jgi:rod shape-determining protein MreD
VIASPTARGAALLFGVALVQAVIVPPYVVAGGSPELLLLTVISLGLVRGSVAGAGYGFAAGLLFDLLTLDTLGLSSLVLTLAGFWAGRYGETTGRGRRLSPLVSVAVITVLAALFAFFLHSLLGDEVVARHALVTVLLPTLLVNVLLAYPVHALVRAIVPEREPLGPAAQRVEVLV